MTAVHLIVKGLVQGVGFRYFVSGKARGLDLTGYVRNLPDGSVEVLAEGDRGRLESLIAVTKVGPRAAQVTDLQVSWRNASNSFKEFEYR